MSPAAKNIRNVRHKVDPIVDKKTVHQVEVVLRSLIETGFAENCDEELLEFDEDGNLVKVTKGITDEMRMQQQADAVFAYKDGANSISDMDQASISVSRPYNDASVISHSRFNDDGDSDSAMDASLGRKVPSGSTSVAPVTNEDRDNNGGVQHSSKVTFMNWNNANGGGVNGANNQDQDMMQEESKAVIVNNPSGSG